MTTNAEQIKKIAALVEVKGIYQEPSGKVTTTEFYKIVITLADESTKEFMLVGVSSVHYRDGDNRYVVDLRNNEFGWVWKNATGADYPKSRQSQRKAE